MEEANKLRIFDYLIFLGLILVLLVGIFLISYYFQIKNKTCAVSPLTYAAEQLEEIYGVSVAGQIFFKDHPNIIYHFDKNNITVSSLKQKASFYDTYNYPNYSIVLEELLK